MSSDTTVELSDAECWQLLAHHTVARLAVDVGGRPDIFPINYLVDDGTLVFRSGPGTKLAGAVLGRHVALEIDGVDEDGVSVWSVVVKGVAHQVEDMEERFGMDDLPLYPWIASQKANFVRISPELTTGRRFRVVDGVDAVGEYHPGAPRLRPG